MTLYGALNIGQSALAVAQAQIQTTGNNIANAGNADYTRQVASTASLPDQQLRQGVFVGTGVDLTGVQRQIDAALESRLRGSAADSAAADATQQWLGRIEATFNELGDADLSTAMSTFFNSWSDLANKPQDTGLRQLVIQDGQSLAQNFQGLRTKLTGLGTDTGAQFKAAVTQA